MNRRPWHALLLALAGIYLAVRSWGAAGDVLSPPAWDQAAREGGGVPMVDEARDRDARLQAATAPERDPFRPPPAPRRTSPGPSTPQSAPEPAPPEVRLILFDQIAPETQISVEGEVSGRLRVGQSFRGWTVESISESRVVVSRDGKSFSLTLRR